MQDCKMWIGGAWVDAESERTFTVRNPATGDEIARLPQGGPADADRAVRAARAAFVGWSKTPQAERSRILNQIAALIRAEVDELARIETIEHGMPFESAKKVLTFASHAMEFAAAAARTLRGEVIRAFPNTVTYLEREPVGVCALITPWNVPLFMICAKLSTALAAGNTCVVKPPSISSLIAVRFAELLARSDLPPGVANIVTGPGGSLGDALCSHPMVDLVGMTGSSETGKAIIASSSRTIKRLVLELGGKNPAIVLPDADLDRAAEVLGHHQFFNSGMTCGSPGRYYVHESVHDAFVDRLVARARKVVVGDPSDPATTMGPVVSAEHRASIENHIRSGVDEGARLVLGGERPTAPPLDRGYYVLPTVFTGVTQTMQIAREEIFGPVACVIRFGDGDDVIALANDNVYGLCGSVWTANLAKGLRMGAELRVGSFWVNQHNHLAPEVPWGGIRESGLGKEASIEGLKEFTQMKLVSYELIG
ncbi:MAG: aldehyde dehydrogenase [Rubrivivax sp.]|nr:aldehyde dehydrogenase [Rubrivivax sp.]